jgi:hypothetical protein
VLILAKWPNVRVGYRLNFLSNSRFVPVRLTQSSTRRFVLAAALLLLAAQTIVVQHIHADASGPDCVVCASTAHHASLPTAVTPLPVADTHPARLTPSLCLAPEGEKVQPGRARAPPTL